MQMMARSDDNRVDLGIVNQCGFVSRAIAEIQIYSRRVGMRSGRGANRNQRRTARALHGRNQRGRCKSSRAQQTDGDVVSAGRDV